MVMMRSTLLWLTDMHASFIRSCGEASTYQSAPTACSSRASQQAATGRQAGGQAGTAAGPQAPTSSGSLLTACDVMGG